MNEEQKPCIECGQVLNWVKPGVSQKTGKPYNGFWACPDKHRQQPALSAPKPTAPAQNFDSMYRCNALNNAVALTVGGVVPVENLQKTFHRCLQILTSEELDSWKS